MITSEGKLNKRGEKPGLLNEAFNTETIVSDGKMTDEW
jgi:hypothetical protein